MADQASVRGVGDPRAGRANGKAGGNGSVTGSLAEFGNDFATLLELQAKLAAADLRECKNRLVLPALAIGAAFALALGCVPVLLLGVADLLSRALRILPGSAMLLTALGGTVLAAVVVRVFANRFASAFEPLRRSREELVRNLTWVRTVLLYSGRSSPRRGG
jgi:uncharacterized membrane protein YqjE